MSTKLLLRSFAGGEITPELAGRLDLVKYQTGLALARNFITLPHGPAVRRPGFEFVNEAKDSTRKVRLIPFSFSASQTVVLEFGHLYVRFHIDGATLLETAKTITSIVGSTVTITTHGYSTGDWVYIGGRYHKVTSTGANTFTTTDLWGVATTAAGSTAARVYTLTTPYDEADLFDLHYAQSADVITIVHPDYAVRELSRLSETSWSLSTVSFVPSSTVPTGVTATPTTAQNQYLTQQKYVVTALSDDGVTETLPSASASATNNLALTGNYNTLTWTGVDGYSRYYVYKYRGGIYGFIGQAKPVTGATTKTVSSATPYQDIGFFKYARVRIVTTAAHGYTTGDRVLVEGTTHFDGFFQITVENTTTFNYALKTQFKTAVNTGTVSIPVLSFTDDNILADSLTSTPEDIIALNEADGDYPSATVYHEQRRWFAGTTAKPQVIWATRTGTEKNLTSSIPVRDADAMELRIASSQYDQIRHLVALSDLIALTAGGEFRIYADGAPAVTPTSVSVKPQGYSGASNVQPAVTSGSMLYVQAQGSRVRELAYNWETNIYRSIDVSIMAPHRFNGYTVTQLAYSRAPDQLLWAVRDDGTLLGLTYVPDQQVFGWHAHDTDGTFESVCVVSEANEDVLYAVVKRSVDGRDVRYIERLHSRLFTVQADAFYVDSGLTYDGAATTTVSGLWHLEGEEVDVLADGAVHPRCTVTDGSITLEYQASVIHIGLPITADLRTLPLALEGAPAAGQGTAKNVNKVYLRVSQSSVVKAGPTFARLREYPARSVTDPYGSAPALMDGEISLSVDPSWNQDAAVCIRQDVPLPLSILSMTLEIQSGG